MSFLFLSHFLKMSLDKIIGHYLEPILISSLQLRFCNLAKSSFRTPCIAWCVCVQGKKSELTFGLVYMIKVMYFMFVLFLDIVWLHLPVQTKTHYVDLFPALIFWNYAIPQGIWSSKSDHVMCSPKKILHSPHKSSITKCLKFHPFCLLWMVSLNWMAIAIQQTKHHFQGYKTCPSHKGICPKYSGSHEIY